jgi:hypothetical protein
VLAEISSALICDRLKLMRINFKGSMKIRRGILECKGPLSRATLVMAAAATDRAA